MIVKVLERKFGITEAAIAFSHEESSLDYYGTHGKDVEITITGIRPDDSRFHEWYHGDDAAEFMEQIMKEEVE